MEKIIFILLPIIYFLYNAYLNFKKEHEKAAKRTSEQPQYVVPTKDITADNIKTIPKYYQDSIRKENKDYQSDITRYLSDQKSERDQINKAARDVNKYNKAAVKDNYNPETANVEVTTNRAIHLQHHHEFEFPSNFKEEFMDFDLRKAVIYDTILKRPNY
ncbi:hypothetical protein A5893_15055 [Pedobacter psychrophilus]|uniref:Uncharacterized protein n=1 Tax=Pedobacter psychrophilus TaxID=1826909 RepID=A0A179DBP4_9SPHI|nr:hypothetical protein [Pedobacter psychrophilus]OAQ38120.1 hypothetical protein A5893_15055 [Pedobacter psychrophilus]